MAIEKIRGFVRDFIDEHPGKFFLLGVSVALGGIGYCIIRSENYRTDLENKMLISADKNNDGMVSKDEMANVYKSIGLKFNEMNPRGLSNSEMGRYLQTYSMEKEDENR